MYIGIMNEFAATYYTMLENMNGRVIEYIRGNKEIKIFGREDAALSQYETSIDKYKTATLRLYNRMYVAASPSYKFIKRRFFQKSRIDEFPPFRNKVRNGIQ